MFDERYHGQRSTFAIASRQQEEFEKRFKRVKKMKFNALKCCKLEPIEPFKEERHIFSEKVQD